MGKWATYRRRGSFPGGDNPAPVLAYSPPEAITWTWAGSDPDTWSIEQSPNPNGPWTPVESQPGASRGFSGLDLGFWYTILGLDGSSTPVTTRSNAVNLP
jgi:hypothetical protein